MTERTPPTGAIRHAFMEAHPFPLTTEIDERGAEFDRWLAKVKADAWGEGHSAGCGWALDPHNGGSRFTNPYRDE